MTIFRVSDHVSDHISDQKLYQTPTETQLEYNFIITSFVCRV